MRLLMNPLTATAAVVALFFSVNNANAIDAISLDPGNGVSASAMISPLFQEVEPGTPPKWCWETELDEGGSCCSYLCSLPKRWIWIWSDNRFCDDLLPEDLLYHCAYSIDD